MADFKRTPGIHTFEIQCELTYEQFLDIKDILYSLSCNTGSRCFSQNNFLKCTIFSNQGMTVFINSHLLKITINPARLIDPDNIAGLYNFRKCGSDPSSLLMKLILLLESFLPESILLQLYISRIDYTIDAYLPSDEHVLLMIKLAKKNGLPKGFRETYSAKIRNAPSFNNAYSYNVSRKDKTYSVTLYAKHKQLSSSRKNIPANVLEKTEGLLRAEITCLYHKNILPLWQKEAFSENFDIDNILATYENVLPKLFPYGTYLKSTVAREILEKQYMNKRTWKKHLLNFLNIIIKYNSFHGAYLKFNNKNILKKDLLNAFYSIGINPVTIAINDKISFLPSIYTILGVHHPFEAAEKSILVNF